MIADHHFVRAAAARIGEVADTTSTALADGLVKSETAFTDRWVRRAAKAVSGFRHQGLRWRAQAHVEPAADAGTYSADLICVLEIDLPDYSSRRGFLAQTLLIEQGSPPDAGRLGELRRRCSVMQAATPAAFVLIYRAKDVIVVPATAVVASSTRPDRLHRRKIGHFFEEFFSSFIGDPRVPGPKSAALEDVVRKQNARAGLALHVELVSTPRQESLFRR